MKKDMSEEKKTKLAYTWAIIGLASSIIVGALTTAGSNQVLPIFLGAATILFGPITAFLYIREVKNGVFKVEEDEDE
ncbi:MAG: hypothetical protein HFE75_16255 [Firmicutes bacterium]|jgi:hypothetical protein|nr:hypothetical protein [Bacillota bacterium]NBI63583.1 hypothetical protein [Clostridiales bacterium]